MRSLKMIFTILTVFFISGQLIQAQTELTEKPASDQKEKIMNAEEEKIKAVWEKILIAVGNDNGKELAALTFNKAVIGWTYLQDGIWLNKEVTVEEYLKMMTEDKNPKPILEFTKSFDISVTEERMAMVIAETIISQFGVPRSREINHIIMMKEKDDWKLFSIAWTVHRLPEEDRKFDLNLFARNYAQVWGGMRPAFVAMFFEENGTLQVNDGDPAPGREAISNVAKSFMTKFPDMKVSFDSLTTDANGVKFYWTLTGTDAGPGGKGNKVKISGYELWQLGTDGLIKNSKGYFSTEEYNRQLDGKY